MHERAQFAHRAMDYIKQMPSSLYQQMMLKTLADKVGLSIEQLKSSEPNTPAPRSEPTPINLTPMVREAIILLIQHPASASPLPALFTKHAPEEAALLIELNTLCLADHPSNTAALLAILAEHPSYAMLVTLAEAPEHTHDHQTAYTSILKRMETDMLTQMIDQLLKQTAKNPLSEEQKQLLQKLLRYKTQLKNNEEASD